ncbi:hypothetical protein FKP32DRAFT_1061799 [Trametes sanguinea]|nr:hypothetical protein FKP32DRAFT_1061799 [Trametes sanguinea]
MSEVTIAFTRDASKSFESRRTYDPLGPRESAGVRRTPHHHVLYKQRRLDSKLTYTIVLLPGMFLLSRRYLRREVRTISKNLHQILMCIQQITRTIVVTGSPLAKGKIRKRPIMAQI